jgi:UDP-N-acetylmuramate dehydrogenase
MSAAVADAIERLDALAGERGVELRADVPLAPLTTLRVGGSADRLTAPATVDELVTVIRLAHEAGVPAFLLGKGSDIVVADAGIRGLVVRVRADAATIDGTMLIAEAGASMTALAKRCAEAGLAGFDWAISIPGTVGGAVWANAGAHGGEMAQVVREVEVLGADGQRARIGPDESAFAYRESRFKHGDEIILGVTIELEGGEPAEIRALVNAHQALRRTTQPLADQNAGSVFRNPPDDHAGRLVEAAGLKGHRLGSARVSELHANFIVTDRGGRAADVRALGDHVRATVANRFGVELRYEIEFVGAWPEPNA